MFALCLLSGSQLKIIYTKQISETDYHSMHIDMEHDKLNQNHLLSAGSHNTYFLSNPSK